MNDKKTVNVSSGVGFTGLLTIVLVIAKLTGHFAHSWWMVFAPMIAGWVLLLVVLAIVLIAALIVAANDR